jgi:hypothetical protein
VQPEMQARAQVANSVLGRYRFVRKAQMANAANASTKAATRTSAMKGSMPGSMWRGAGTQSLRERTAAGRAWTSFQASSRPYASRRPAEAFVAIAEI